MCVLMTTPTLTHRQATGGTIAVYNNVTEETWMFMKEISSDGDVSTVGPLQLFCICTCMCICLIFGYIQVDVIYPSSPLFLWSSTAEFSPMKLIVLPILNYANNKTAMYGLNILYNLPWAPHHLGHWPSEEVHLIRVPICHNYVLYSQDCCNQPLDLVMGKSHTI